MEGGGGLGSKGGEGEGERDLDEVPLCVHTRK